MVVSFDYRFIAGFSDKIEIGFCAMFEFRGTGVLLKIGIDIFE